MPMATSRTSRSGTSRGLRETMLPLLGKDEAEEALAAAGGVIGLVRHNLPAPPTSAAFDASSALQPEHEERC